MKNFETKISNKLSDLKKKLNHKFISISKLETHIRENKENYYLSIILNNSFVTPQMNTKLECISEIVIDVSSNDNNVIGADLTYGNGIEIKEVKIEKAKNELEEVISKLDDTFFNSIVEDINNALDLLIPATSDNCS